MSFRGLPHFALLFLLPTLAVAAPRTAGKAKEVARRPAAKKVQPPSTAQLSVGMNFAFPMAQFQHPVVRGLYLGVMASVVDYPLEQAGKRLGWGGLATVALYPYGWFAGTYVMAGAGVMATRTFVGLETDESVVTPALLLAAGMRIPLAGGFSLGFGGGVNAFPVRAKRLAKEAPVLLPAVLIDVGLGI